MLSALNAGIIVTFFYIIWRTVAIINEEADNLGALFLPGFLVVIFLPLLLYLIYAFRAP